jgi:hypothetical protein
MDATGWSRGGHAHALACFCAAHFAWRCSCPSMAPWQAAVQAAAGDETPPEPTCQTNKRASAAQQYHPPPTEISTHPHDSGPFVCVLSLLHGEAVDIAILSVSLVGCCTEVPYSAVHSLAHCLIHLACAILFRLQPSLVSM